MIVGSLTSMRRINFMPSRIEHENLNITSGPGKRTTLQQSQVNNKQVLNAHDLVTKSDPEQQQLFFRSNTLCVVMKDLEEFEKMESEFILKMVFMETLHLLQPIFNVSRTYHVQPKS